MRASALVALASLVLSVSVAAPADAWNGDTVVAPGDGRATVAVRTRPDQAGDLYRFQSDTEFVQTDDHGGQTQTNRQVFDLEVLAVEPEGGLRLRYTLREAQVKDSSGASMEAALKAMVGDSLEFRIGREGRLSALDNWPVFRDQMQQKVDAALPEHDPVRALVRQRLGQPPLLAADEMVLGDVRLMAAMEIPGVAPLGITDLNPDRPAAGRATLDVSIVRPDCRVQVKRETSRSASGVSRAVVSEAEVAVTDGRVVTLTERRVTRAPGGSQTETIKIRRLSTPPAC